MNHLMLGGSGCDIGLLLLHRVGWRHGTTMAVNAWGQTGGGGEGIESGKGTME